MEKSENSLNQFEVGSGTCPPSGRCVPSLLSFYFTFLMAQRTDNPPKAFKYEMLLSRLAGSDFLCNTKTQIMEDGLDPMHGKTKGLGAPLWMPWELLISDGLMWL